jgi:hypothetical protein
VRGANERVASTSAGDQEERVESVMRQDWVHPTLMTTTDIVRFS